MLDVVGIVMKYVSIAAILNIPRYYFESMWENQIKDECERLSGNDSLRIMKRRRDNPREGAHWTIHVLRVIHKSCRIIFCTFGFYFTPFAGIFANVRLMVVNSSSA